MSDLEINVSDQSDVSEEVLEEYEYNFYTRDKAGNKTKHTVYFRPWNLISAPKNFKLVGKVIKQVREARPDMSIKEMTKHLDVVLYEASEPAFQIIENSIPRNLNAQSKQLLMENTGLDGAAELLEAIIRLNFFHPNLAKRMKSLFGLLKREKQSENQTGQE